MTVTRTYLIIILAWLVGCTTTPQERPKVPSQVADPAVLAKQLEGQGKHLEAAREYLRLAGSKPPPTRQGYQLSAIQAYLKAGKLEEAKAHLAHLDVSRSFGLELPLELIRTKLDLLENRVEEALKRLRGIEPTTLPHPLHIQYRQLQAEVLALQGQVVASLQDWVQLSADLSRDEPQAAKENARQLWQMLTSLSENTLQKELKKSQDHTVTGWLELALLNKTLASKHLATALNSWHLRYPQHPANPDIVKQLVQVSKPPTSMQVALLLPKSDSRFKKQADAVREGFFAAAYGDPQRPHIAVHQVDADNVLKIYEEVVNSGVNWVVGPLEKEALTLLAKNHPILPVPTLGLNYIEEPTTPGNFYQFGLLPADEAQAVAHQAWQDGHRQALGVVPEGEWGERILKAFQGEWEKQGGKLLASLNYGDDFEKTLKKLLKSSPPADLVFMVVFPEFAAKMRRLITEAFGEKFPIYSTSHIYSGTPNPQKDLELEGIKFVDMPWILNPDDRSRQLQTNLQHYGAEGMQKFKRLYAFGVDAYTLSPQLHPPKREWAGQSGHLRLENNGEIHRDRLLWAHFVKGTPQLLTPK